MFKPTVMISVPYGVTSVEKRAVHEAALRPERVKSFSFGNRLLRQLVLDCPSEHLRGIWWSTSVGALQKLP
jgi:hypothetical protein